MRTRRNRSLKMRKSRSAKMHRKMSRAISGGKKSVRKSVKKSVKKSGKKWVTAIDAAQKTLRETGSLEQARMSLRKQALTNARKLFGSISSI